MTQSDPPTSLPRGHVTFVMTDIEGSTRLFRELGDSYVEVLSQHNELLRAAFAAHGGVEVGTEGDSLFVAFQDAAEAVSAALEGQFALSSHTWPKGFDIKVRMGIHGGEAEPVGNDYVSLVVHQVARISSGAHGGQVLLSETTAGDVKGALPDGAELNLLGAFQLRGFPNPEKLFQLEHPGLGGEFPPLRAIGVVSHNLPFVRTSFVGRAQERAALTRTLGTTGVVSIVGPGGVGKTRLAVQVALDVTPEFEHGAWLVDLIPVTGAASLVRSVANVLGIAEEVGRDLRETLLTSVAGKEMLLVLDNCEHVIDQAAVLAETLSQRCPRVTILATSREPLDIDGEVVWRVEPLRTASSNGEPSDAVQLFSERATLSSPGFELSETNRNQVEEIVAHLNGIPLAIELAAAALRDRSLDGVLSGLTDRFSMLTGGRRTAPDRHQTLKAALEWSLDLLQPGERRLYQRLSVFSGSGSVEAAAEICQGGPVSAAEIPALLGRLKRASLLSPDPEDSDRWTMLESLRHLASLELDESGESEQVEHRHRVWFMRFAESAGQGIGGRDQARVMKALDLDRQNVGRAIDSAVAAGDADVALRLSSAMAAFWTSHGDWAEGIDRLRAALSLEPDDPGLCAKAQVLLGRLQLLSGDLAGAEASFGEARVRAADAGDDLARARALAGAGFVAFRHSELEEAESLWGDALAFAEDAGEERVIAEVLRSFAIAVASKGDQARAGELLERAMESARNAGDDQLLRLLLGSWAEMNLWLGRYQTASGAYGDALALSAEIGDISARPLLLAELGWTALLSGDPVKARELASEAAEFAEDLNSPRVLAHSLRLEGEALLRLGRHEESGEMLDGALDVARGLDAPAEVAGVLCSMAFRSLHLRDLGSAQAKAEEAIGMAGIGHTMRQVLPDWVLGVVALHDDRADEAERRFAAVARTADSAQLMRHRASAEWGLAEVSAARGSKLDAAKRHLAGLERRIAIDDRLGVANSLVGLASALESDGAGNLVSAAASLRSEAGAVATPLEEAALEGWDLAVAAGGSVDLSQLQDNARELVTRKEEHGMA